MSVFKARRNQRIEREKRSFFLNRWGGGIKIWARKHKSSDFCNEMGKLSKKELFVALSFTLLDIAIVVGIASLIFRITFFRDYPSPPWCWVWSVVLALVLWIGASIILYKYHERQAAAERRLAEKLTVK